MSKLHGKKTRVYLNGWDVSNYFNGGDAVVTGDTAESSGFGDEDKTFEQGLAGGSYRLQGQFDDRAGTIGTEERFMSILQSEVNPIIALVRETEINGAAHGGEVIETNLAVSTPVAGIAALNADMLANEKVYRLAVVNPKGDVAGTTVATAAYNGGTATVYGATVVGHFFGASGTPVVVVEHSATGTSAWSTMASFAAVPAGDAPQAQIVSATGTIQPFLRANASGGTAEVWIGVHQPIG